MIKIVINKYCGTFRISDACAGFMAASGHLEMKKALSETREYYEHLVRDDRANLFLVEAVETLGFAASGVDAHLGVIEIPDEVDWSIEEYDGREHIAEKHRTWE